MKPAPVITVIKTPTGKTVADFGIKAPADLKPEFGPVDPEGYAQWQKDRDEVHGAQTPIPSGPY